jgi:hypothetical protein
MKRSLFILVVVAVAAVGILGAMLVTAGPTAAAPLSQQEADDLQFAREEEKLARDVYSFLDGVWGGQIGLFANIAVSEDTHTLAIGDLLKKYRVDDPAKHDVPGEFVNEVLQHEYDHLVVEGSASLVAALEVGVYIEKMDIIDLTLFQGRTTHRDIERVYGNLIDGSWSHLAAFENALE